MPVRINPGEFNRRLKVQSFTETRGAHGGIVRTYSTDFERFASVRAMASREYTGQRQAQADASHVITMRRCTALTSEHRLVDTQSGTVYEIDGVPRATGYRDRYVEVFAKVAE